jgi:hypothetical protein
LLDRTFSRFGRNRCLARDFANLAARFCKGWRRDLCQTAQATTGLRRFRIFNTGSRRDVAATIIAGPRELSPLPYCRLDIDDLDRFDVVGFARIDQQSDIFQWRSSHYAAARLD